MWRYAGSCVLLVGAIASLFAGGGWVWSIPVITFVLLPALEQLSPGSTANPSEADEAAALANPWFDRLLFAIVPGQFALVLAWIDGAAHGRWSGAEALGALLTAGIGCGVFGINVAHELGHRASPAHRFAAKALLLTSLYQHFIVEHNRGHHLRVATPDDPATSRRGETLYAFWIRSISGGLRSAWDLEDKRLRALGRPVWGPDNEVARLLATEALAIAVVAGVWGFIGVIAWAAAALIGVLLLETVNYVEHYGLVRERLPSGRYTRVQPAHSWNSNRDFGRALLFELTRHADHHANARRPYPVLRHCDDAPQLPAGYPAMILLSLIPPLWFRVMNAELDRLTPVDTPAK